MRRVKIRNYDISGWTKHLVVTDEDRNEFPCTLSWSEGFGYDLDWGSNGEPDFYTTWDEDKEGMFFELWLDTESEE